MKKKKLELKDIVKIHLDDWNHETIESLGYPVSVAFEDESFKFRGKTPIEKCVSWLRSGVGEWHLKDAVRTFMESNFNHLKNNDDVWDGLYEVSVDRTYMEFARQILRIQTPLEGM